MTHATTLSISDLDLTDCAEPRVRDIRIAERLGMGNPRSIRETIEANRAELERYGGLSAVPTNPTRKGGRPGIEYHLNEAQTPSWCCRVPGYVWAGLGCSGGEKRQDLLQFLQGGGMVGGGGVRTSESTQKAAAAPLDHAAIFMPGFRPAHVSLWREGGEYNTRKGNKPAQEPVFLLGSLSGSYPPATRAVVRSRFGGAFNANKRASS